MNMIITTLTALFIASFIGFQATLVVSIIQDYQEGKSFEDKLKKTKNINMVKTSVMRMIFQEKSSKI